MWNVAPAFNIVLKRLSWSKAGFWMQRTSTAGPVPIVKMYRRKWEVCLHKSVSSMAGRTKRRGSENLHASCRFFLLFGKLIGLIPYDLGPRPGTKTAQARYEGRGPFSINGWQSKRTIHCCSGTAAQIISLTIMTSLSVEALVGFQSAVRSKFVNVADYFKMPHMFAFYATGTFM